MKKKLKRDQSGIAGMPKTADTKHLKGRKGMVKGVYEDEPKKMPTDPKFVTDKDLKKWGTL